MCIFFKSEMMITYLLTCTYNILMYFWTFHISNCTDYK